MLKEGVRILAIDDSILNRNSGVSLAVGVIGRDGAIEGILSFKATIDGTDSTDLILNALKKSRFSSQIKLIALNGVTLSGLNIIDVDLLNRKTGLPILAMTRKRPRRTYLKRALLHDRKRAEKARLISKLYSRIKTSRMHGYYVQRLGISEEDSSRFAVRAASMLRLAHMIASGVSRGESKGRV